MIFRPSAQTYFFLVNAALSAEMVIAMTDNFWVRRKSMP
jgi:hypothetical protein